MSLPWSEVGPVRSTRLPILMICASAGTAPRPRASRPSTTDSASGRGNRLMMTSFVGVRRCTSHITSPSVGVGPQLPVAPETLPDAHQALGLVHQEEDDGQAEDDVAGGGDKAE